MRRSTVSVALLALVALGCESGGSETDTFADSGDGSMGRGPDATIADGAAPDGQSGRDAPLSADTAAESGPADAGCTVGDPDAATPAALCYSITCPGSAVHTLQDNRDRLIADLAHRKCTDSCTLWAALNEAERYVFLMDTAYFGAPSSLLHPPGMGNLETALDHAVALYSINGPKAGQGVQLNGLGGNDYNRIYLGFDALAECVMRSFSIANPMMSSGGNQWVKSDDLAGPHAPFTQREMIFWYKATFDLQSNGPQFHHWHQDADLSQSGIDQRLGVCGCSDRSLVESTIAFDFYHNSNPLGDYGTRGGYGWQIVDHYVGIPANWAYMPTGCSMTAPVNMDPVGGGTFAGMGPVLDGGACTNPILGDGGC